MPQTPKPAPKLRDQLHAIIRTKHYSLRTEKTYWYWIRYFIRFHRLRHPRDMAEAALAHKLENKVEEAYRRSDALEKRREMMQEWGKFILTPTTN